ncbi:RDD family protein [Sorangium sp. So ce341]|uniref:RDD family protein n=1 Tax=Sorangium sp. So ce341 TaxID=3133302 RepID=UPI003F5FCC3E
MTLRWYTRRDENATEKGPFEETAITEAVKSGNLKRSTLVRREDETNWSTIEHHPEFRAVGRSGRETASERTEKSDYRLDIRAHAEYARDASRGARLAARTIDNFVAFALPILSVVLFEPGDIRHLAMAIGGGIFVLYFLFADGLNGQSLGKRVFLLAVVDERTGRRCGFGESVLRNLTRCLGVLDFVWIFGVQRRRLGDIVAKTRVITLSQR